MSRAVKLIFKMCVGNFLKLFCDGCEMVVLSHERNCLKWSGGYCLHARKKMLATNELWFFLVVFCLA